MDINYLQLFPKNHFGKTFEAILSEIESSESSFVYGVQGSGVLTLLQQLFNILQKEDKIKVLYYKSDLIKDNAIEVITSDIINLNKSANLNEAIVNLNKKFVIIIDSIQKIENLQKFLEFIESLRKSSTYKIVYIAGTDHAIFDKVKDAASMQTLHSVHKLGMFSLDGTVRNIKINSRFFSYNIPQELFGEIYELSGGHPRLTKYICKVIYQNGFDKLKDLNFLANHILIEPILNHFIELILSLDQNDLVDLEILTKDNQLFSKLLKYKLENFEISNLDLMFNNLTSKERRVFSYLFMNKDKVVSPERIDFIFRLVGSDYSLWASYKAINRLKLKISAKFTLLNVKGKGYVLKTL